MCWRGDHVMDSSLSKLKQICNPDSILENTTFEKDVSIKRDKIKFSQTFFKTFLQPSVENSGYSRLKRNV